MKRFSQLQNISEACVTSDVNPGNALSQTGIMNHYTPVENILTNIKNIYCVRLGVVASVAEDGVSIKLNSTKFVNKDNINSVLNEILDGTRMGLGSYIQSQGLDKMKIVDLGMYKVVYFSPSDIKIAAPGLESNPCQEMLDLGLQEAEMLTITEGGDDDVELEDETRKSLMELIKTKDKVKAAKQFSIIVSKEVALPEEYYFCGVKDSDGTESIALRWRYIKRRPHGKSVENTRSLINIYGDGKDAIWVQDFDEDGYFKLPDETKKLIEQILELLDAQETKDKCVWSIGEEKKKEEEEKKDEDNDKDKNDSSDNDSSDNGSSDSSDEDKDNKEDKSDEDTLL